MIKLVGMELAGHVERMREMGNKILVRKLERKKPLEII
jgi:hypothetical protein